MFGKYKRAFKEEIKWLDEDIRICQEMLDQIDRGEKIGWSHDQIQGRLHWAKDEKNRLMDFLQNR